MPRSSPKIPVQLHLSTEETRNTPATEHECSAEISLQTERLCDVTDTYPYM